MYQKQKKKYESGVNKIKKENLKSYSWYIHLFLLNTLEKQGKNKMKKSSMKSL